MADDSVAGNTFTGILMRLMRRNPRQVGRAGIFQYLGTRPSIARDAPILRARCQGDVAPPGGGGQRGVPRNVARVRLRDVSGDRNDRNGARDKSRLCVTLGNPRCDLSSDALIREKLLRNTGAFMA